MEGLPPLSDSDAQLRRLRALLALSEASAALHAEQAARLGRHLATLQASRSWRLARWLRAPAQLVQHPRRALRAGLARLRAHRPRARLRRVLREEGWRATFRKSLVLLRNLAAHGIRHLALRLSPHDALPPASIPPHLPRALPTLPRALTPRAPTLPSLPPARLFTPNVLIVAELSLPQCAKYRVWQKREQLASLGIACEVRDWTDADAARDAMQLCTMVIFYRVPGHAPVLALYDEARRLGLEAIWEVDDLIFDAALYLADRDLTRLDADVRRGALAGAALYARAWAAADRGIASTPALAALMAAHSPHPVDIVENALDLDTLSAADLLLARRASRPEPATLTILYGSGSRTHDGDFALAAPALATILARHPALRLRLVGELAIPTCLHAHADRIDRTPALAYRDYLAVLADADINLAPLEDTPFNSAKSNIKFVEAGILAIPSVCSPVANFAAAITHGVDGWLPRDEAGWTDGLDRLITDADHRHAMGRAARASVLDRYAPARIAATRLAPLLAPLRETYAAERANGRLRVLAIGAGQRLDLLDDSDDIAPSLFVIDPDLRAPPYALRRLTDRAWPVIALRVPPQAAPPLALDDPQASVRLAHLLDALRPDIVLMLGLHGLGAGAARTCLARDIPYVLDLSDRWWRASATASRPDLAARLIEGVLAHAAALIAPDIPTSDTAIAAGAPPSRIVPAPDDAPALHALLRRLA